MSSFIPWFAAVVLSVPLVTLGGQDPVASLRAGQPKQVASIIDRIVGCNHWLGEEPYDKERATEINNATIELGCSSLEKDEAYVRTKYRKRLKVQKAIDVAHEVYL